MTVVAACLYRNRERRTVSDDQPLPVAEEPGDLVWIERLEPSAEQLARLDSGARASMPALSPAKIGVWDDYVSHSVPFHRYRLHGQARGRARTITVQSLALRAN